MSSRPKQPRERNPALLELARDKDCLLRVVQCRPGTTVAAHSNWAMHGKAKAMKAHDYYTVWACSSCHNWLDSSYSATLEEKKAAFLAAHERQIEAWKQDGSKPALWALERLSAQSS
jgi:Protein of unknown function (DUF1364)